MAIQESEPVGMSSLVASVTWGQRVRAFIDLTKPRIMIMLLYTGIAGMVVAGHHLPSLGVLLATCLGLVLSTGGSAALNMWYDRDIDVIMKRTQNRPIPRGLVKPSHALVYGISLIVVSFVELGLLVNWLTASMAVAGAVYYVLIYTFWLKRRTPQNIVIGGGAGAFPPIIGAAAVTGTIPWSAVLMFLIIFFWTPPHFWSLALYKNEEYKRANIPMMPVVEGEAKTKRQSVAYGIVLFVIAEIMPLTAKMSWGYWPISAVLAVGFMYYLIKTLKEPTGSYQFARKSFVFSLLYLTVLFLALPAACLL